MADGEKTIDRLTSVVKSLVEDCETYRDEGEKQRTRSNEYFDGKMTDLEEQDGRSKVVSRDVRTNIKKALPSLIRTILGNDKVVEFEPVAEDDEEHASRAAATEVFTDGRLHLRRQYRHHLC